MYLVIRIKGTVSVLPKVKTTLDHLNLRRANNASVWPETTPGIIKMFQLVDHMVAYGKVSDEALAELVEKRGEAIEGKLDTKKVLAELKAGKSANSVGLINCFTLSPPRKGFERKGIKKPFNMGGAYGNRGEKISELVVRMI